MIGLLPFSKCWINSGRVTITDSYRRRFNGAINISKKMLALQYWHKMLALRQRRKLEEDNLMVKRWTMVLKDRVEDGISEAI